MTSEVFMAMKIQVVVFCFVTPCSDVVGYQRFWGPYCFHIQSKTFIYTTSPHRGTRLEPAMISCSIHHGRFYP